MEKTTEVEIIIFHVPLYNYSRLSEYNLSPMNGALISNKWRLVRTKKKLQSADQAHSSIPRALQPGWRLLVNVQPCAGNGSYRSLRTTTGLSPRPSALHSVFIHEPATFRVRVLPDTCNPDTIPPPNPFFESEIAMPRTRWWWWHRDSTGIFAVFRPRHRPNSQNSFERNPLDRFDQR